MARAKKPRAPKLVWEPGYNGHVYWRGKEKVGKVTRHPAKGAQYKYTWEAAGRAGGGDDLEKAKRAVEEAVAMAGRQMDLFGQ